MSRSVSYANNSVHVEYATFECEDEYEAQDEFRYCLEDFQRELCDTFPSVSKCDKWIGREDHAVAENRFAYFGVSEYCGLVSMWVAPKDDGYATSTGPRDHWVDQIGPKFRKVAGSCFGQALQQIGRFSNGEAFFQPINGQQHGALGLGFSSKEGWL